MEQLVEAIEKYESDTFSAEGSAITHDEAVKTAEQLIEWWTDRSLDGVIITEALEEVRA